MWGRTRWGSINPLSGRSATSRGRFEEAEEDRARPGFLRLQSDPPAAQGETRRVCSTCFISFRGGAISPIAPLFFRVPQTSMPRLSPPNLLPNPPSKPAGRTTDPPPVGREPSLHRRPGIARSAESSEFAPGFVSSSSESSRPRVLAQGTLRRGLGFSDAAEATVRCPREPPARLQGSSGAVLVTATLVRVECAGGSPVARGGAGERDPSGRPQSPR